MSSLNHYVVMCRSKCNIIWRVRNIYDRAIIIIMIINKYILYISNPIFPWIKYIYNIYSFIIIIYIYIYIYVCVCVCVWLSTVGTVNVSW